MNIKNWVALLVEEIINSVLFIITYTRFIEI